MKQIIYLSLLLTSVVFMISCDKKPTVNELADSELIKFIADNNNPTKGLERIDSILKSRNSFSTHQEGLLYYNKATYLNELEKYIPAIVNTEKALLLFESEKNKKFTAIATNHLAIINTTLGKTKLALKQIETAIVLFKEIDDKNNESIALGHLARLQYMFGDLNSAIESLTKASDIQLKLELYSVLSASYNNTAYVLEDLKDFNGAKEYYKKAIALHKKSKELNSSALENLAALYLMENKIEKSKHLYLEALKIEESRAHLPRQRKLYEGLLNLSTKAEDYKWITKYTIKKDSISELISALDEAEKIKDIETRYQLIAKQNELEQEMNMNTKNKIIFLSVLGLLFFIGLFLFQRNRNAKLSLSQEKLILEQRVLRTQMNPHFIFNSLGAIQKTMLENDPLKSASLLSKFSKLIRKYFEFTNKTEITLADDLEALTNYIETQQLRFVDEFNYKLTIQEGIDITNLMIPPMLLQPFVENAIEHGIRPLETKGLLEINIAEGGDFIHFEIVDNGIGISDTKKNTKREHATDIFIKRLKFRKFGEEKLFSIKNREDTQGTKVTLFLKLFYAQNINN